RAWPHQTRPAHHCGDAIATLPVGVFLAAEDRGAAVGPAHRLGAIVRGIDDDCVVGDTEIVELLQQLTDLTVVLHHAIGINAETGFALGLLLEIGPDVHAAA